MKSWIISLILITIVNFGYSQNFPEGISYQAQVYSSTGGLLSNQIIGVQFNIRETTLSGNISWQENHVITVNELGHFSVIIGQGTSTNIGSSPLFSDINWDNGNYFLEMLVDENNVGIFISTATQQMMAVPFAFHSKTSSQEYKLSELSDVDTLGIQIGDVLKWDGVKWIASIDISDIINDSILFSHFSDSANFATYATYALNCQQSTIVDSSYSSYLSDSSIYSLDGYHSEYSDSSNYSDTAGIAIFSIGNWGLNGNSLTDPNTNFIGTIDSTDLVFKSHNAERLRIKGNGDIGFGTASPLTNFHVNNADGVLFTGDFGVGDIPIEGSGTRMMWYPNKAAFRSGYVSSNSWDDLFIGDYSFASGYNTKASGDYSVAFGFNSNATNEGAFAVGNAAAATGLYSFAAGHDPSAFGDYSIALGRGATSNGYGAIAIGYHPTASGQHAMGLGNYVFALADNSYALGYHSRTLAGHDGSFIYGDQSTATYVESTAANQFMVRATGGTIFYTSSDLSTGVILAPGAGAWSILSDSTLKENIKPIIARNSLSKLDEIDIYSWNYISQNDSINHIGPMAQDFYATFNLGNDSTTINSGDFDGVNLLLLKGLNEKLGELENQNNKITQLEYELKNLRNRRMELEEKLKKLDSKISNKE